MCTNVTHQISELDESGTTAFSDGNFPTDSIDWIGCLAHWNFNKSIMVILYGALVSLSISLMSISKNWMNFFPELKFHWNNCSKTWLQDTVGTKTEIKSSRESNSVFAWDELFSIRSFPKLFDLRHHSTLLMHSGNSLQWKLTDFQWFASRVQSMRWRMTTNATCFLSAIVFFMLLTCESNSMCPSVHVENKVIWNKNMNMKTSTENFVLVLCCVASIYQHYVENCWMHWVSYLFYEFLLIFATQINAYLHYSHAIWLKYYWNSLKIQSQSENAC